VRALGIRGDTLFAGGDFSRIGSEFRYGFAAIDAVTGALVPWPFYLSGGASAIAVVGNRVFVGGSFDGVEVDSSVGYLPRANLLVFDGTNGKLLPWSPDVTGPREDGFGASVNALAVHGTRVFVGGDFTVIGGKHIASLAAVDGISGEILEDWNPNPDQSVWSLLADGNTLYAGGYLQAAQGVPHLGLIAVQISNPKLIDVPAGPLGPIAVALAPIAPNPIRSQARVRYTLPVASAVTLELYDIQGRRVETVVDHQPQAPGEHELRVDASHLVTGCYLYRLEAAGTTATRKVVVLR
jgi:hypothetical protein